MRPRIETVTAATLDELLPLVRDYCDFYDRHPSEEALRAISRALIADPDREGIQFLARAPDGPEPVGFATLYWTWETNHGGRIGVMNDLFTVAEHRGDGVGRALIAACAGACRQRKITELSWVTAPENVRAQRLYDSTGATRSQWLEYSLEIS